MEQNLADLKSIERKLEGARYIDAHIHLDCFSSDKLNSCILEAGRRDILFFHNGFLPEDYLVSLDESLEKRTVKGLGYHPIHSCQKDSYPDNLSICLEEAAFIGEIGLDFHWVENRQGDNSQRTVFHQMMDWTNEYGKPCQIHSKGAEEEILENLKGREQRGALIHWYSGPIPLIPEFLELGCFFTAGPDLLQGQSSVLNRIPLERLLLESDGPEGIPWSCGVEHRADIFEEMYHFAAKAYGLNVSAFQERMQENAWNWLN